MYRKIPSIISIVCLLSVISPLLSKPGANETMNSQIDIPYEKIILDNGLTLIVHEDHKAPIVAVNVWYHVGSKNEKLGKSGFAHLFEHLMFNGSENFDDDYFQAMERIGATDLNGTTNEDRTNYFQNVPTPALDVALWMESDRMGHLLAAITQEKLDEQRGVVQNEKRQYENQPYGAAYELIVKSTYPSGHPYSWSVIGSMEDLNAASLEDVHEWFKTYYGAANAIIVLAGDIDSKTAREKVEEYFGDIASGPPVARHNEWIAKRIGEQRQQVQDRVPQARLYKIWNIPRWESAEADYMDLVSDVLASGKNSRLYKRLVYEDQIATDVSAYLDSREIGGQFYIEATANPGGDLVEVEKAVDEELARLITEGIAEKELERVKSQYMSKFIRGIERIGGFGGKSDILAKGEVFAGNPSHYKESIQHVQTATVTDLQKAAKVWLSDGVYVLEIHPFQEFTTTSKDVDRTKLPVSGTPPEVKFPELQRTTLSNGLKVVLAERHSIPLVNFNLMVDAGYAADQNSIPGTANLAMNMLDEGTDKRSSLQISEELALLGAELNTGSNLDISSVSLSSLKSNLDASLDIFADVILHPSFPEDEFKRLQKEQMAEIQREKATPILMALRVFPKLLYGENHAYGNPFTGSGYEETVEKLTTQDLKDFHKTWFKPNNATLLICGATSLDEITSKLESLFKKWKAGDIPTKNISEVSQKEKSVIYLVDRPGSIQSIIFAGHVFPPQANPEELAIETMNRILGGSFTSRINMNLREDKHWTYGARSIIPDARGQRPFFVYSPIQSDKTKESMTEINKELKGIISTNPVTDEEMSKVKKNMTLTLAGKWETIRSVGNSASEIIRFGLPDDYYQTYADEIMSLKLNEIVNAAKSVIYPDKLVWVVVGDRSKIEEGIRELGFGEIHHIDGDGNALMASANVDIMK